MTESAADMVNRCFRHQHPEAYGYDPVDDGIVPANLRFGMDAQRPSDAVLHEERMGHPEAVPL